MMVLVINILILVAFVLFQSKFAVVSSNKPLFWIALLVKLAAGLVVGMLYQYYFHGGDTINYYKEATEIAGLFKESPGRFMEVLLSDGHDLAGGRLYKQPRTLFFIKVVGVIKWITHGNYWIIGLYLSLISFQAFWYLFETISEKYPVYRKSAIIAFLFFPTVILWSSGLLKESLAMAAVCVICALVIQGLPKAGISLVFKAILFIISSFVLWKLRYFYLAVLVPVVGAFVAVNILGVYIKKIKRSWLARSVAFLVVWLLIILVVSNMHFNLRRENIARVVYNNYQKSAEKSKEGYYIEFKTLTPSFTGMLKSVPKAFFSGIYRPNVWDYKTPLYIPLIVENVFLLLLTLWFVIKKYNWSHMKNTLVLACVFFILQLSVLLSLSSPNFGSLSRYRIGYLPFLVFLLISAAIAYKKRPDNVRSSVPDQ